MAIVVAGCSEVDGGFGGAELQTQEVDPLDCGFPGGFFFRQLPLRIEAIEH